MSLPPTPKVEIEFTAGVWTDVSADVDWTKGITCSFGRTSEFSPPKVASLSLELDDSQGKYAPKNPSSPYYPNVVPRKRIRYSLSAGANLRFVGYIKGFPPTYDGTRRIVPITALDRFDILGRQYLRSMYQHEVLSDAPVAYWPFSDQAGTASGSVAEISGNAVAANWTFRQNAATDAYALGAQNPRPYSDGATGLTVTSATSANGLAGLYSTNVTTLPTLSSGGATIELWFTMLSGFSASFGGFTAIESPPGATRGPGFAYYYMQVQPGSGTTGTLQGYVSTASGGLNRFTCNVPVVDGKPHHFALVVSTTAGTQTIVAYVDGVAVSTSSVAASAENFQQTFGLCETGTTGTTAVVAGVSDVALYTSALSAARVLAHYQAGAGTLTETTGNRIARILGYAGLISSEYALAAGAVTVGPQDLAGKSVVAACQAMAVTEGGGAVVFVDTNGKVRFGDSTYRIPRAPDITFDAVADLDGSQFAPAYDDTAIVNDSTVTRYGGSSFEYVDTVSTNANGTITDSATSYGSTDVPAANLAQDRVARQSTARLRIPTLVVDFLTATTAGLWTALNSITIGSRARVQSIPTTEVTPAGTFVRFPFSTLDTNIEGWTETASLTAYTIRFDASAADAPAVGVWDDTSYGRWQPDVGTLSLNASITSAAPTVVIYTIAGHPTFSTSAGDYPLQIVIDDEVLTLVNAPSGSASPQTFTGVLRGQANTIPAAHANLAPVNLYPTATWSM